MEGGPSGLARLVVASGLSNLADGVFQITLALVALGITRDPGAFATVTLVGRLPWLLLALPAGALADRLDRRRTMVRVQLGRAALIGALAAVVAGDREELWILYLVAAGLGTGEVLFDTAAQAIVPAVVADPDDLTRANSRLFAVELTANAFVGPPLGGFVAGLTLVGALTGSAVAYLAAAGCLLALTGSFRPVREGPPTRLGADVREGVTYLFRNRVLRTIAVCVGLGNLASTGTMALLPLFAVDPGPLGLTEGGFGLLLTSGAIGAVVMSPFVDRFAGAIGRARVLLLATMAFPLFPLTLALTTSVPAAVAAGVLSGAMGVTFNVTAITLRQRTVPDHLLGRVTAGHRTLAWGSMPLGAALAGLMGETVGLRTTFAVLAMAFAPAVPLLLRHVREADIAAAAPAP